MEHGGERVDHGTGCNSGGSLGKELEALGAPGDLGCKIGNSGNLTGSLGTVGSFALIITTSGLQAEWFLRSVGNYYAKLLKSNLTEFYRINSTEDILTRPKHEHIGGVPGRRPGQKSGEQGKNNINAGICGKTFISSIVCCRTVAEEQRVRGAFSCKFCLSNNYHWVEACVKKRVGEGTFVPSLHFALVFPEERRKFDRNWGIPRSVLLSSAIVVR